MSKDIKIFLASSNELADERDKINLWINDKSESLESQGIKLKLIRWEKLPHHFRAERVQNYFTQEMLKCDIVVIVFKQKVGPFTREEFDQAYAHFKEHGRPHLFVFFWDVGITRKEYRKYEEVIELQETIEAHQQIYKTFVNMEDLENQLIKQLDLVIPEITKTLPVNTRTDEHADKNLSVSKKPTGFKQSNNPKKLHLFCNRNKQALDFTVFFNKNLNNNNPVKFIFFYGPSDTNSDECPDSFIKRLSIKEIKDYWENKYDSLKYIINKKSISIPEKKMDWNDQKEVLIQGLHTAFSIIANDYKLSDFYQHHTFEKPNVIILYHEISINKWNDKLLAWYINEHTQHSQFFSQNTVKPKLLLFFYIKIDDFKERTSFFYNPCKRCQKNIDKLFKKSGKDFDHTLLLEPLQPIEPKHVRQWFNELKLENPDIIESEIEHIFNGAPRISMRKIESKLCSFITNIDKKNIDANLINTNFK
ncbi:MAG: hypothetical protein HQK75_17550 [Candidatus Magnetomorum sp.]|nr:hypothetical protein [Candidatus Magnetomorum sp.]